MSAPREVRPPMRAAIALAAVLVCVAAARPAAAQQVVPPAIGRLESFAKAGKDSAALATADSILADSDPAADAYPDALYWRGVLRKAAGRVDLMRLVVDYPTHARTADALYALAREDLAAGHHDLGESRLERIVRDFAGSGPGATAAAQLARLRLADGRMAEACAAFDSALAHIPDDQVEFRNRVAYDARPCERWKEMVADSVAEAARLASAASRPARGTGGSRENRPRGSARDSGATPSGSQAGSDSAPAARRRSDSGASRPAPGRWSVQVAAYGTRAEAARLADRLKALGYEARVASSGPFRVRVGRYATLAGANEVAAKLKKERFTAIVVEAERP